MAAWVYFAIAAVMAVIAYALQPQAPKTKAPSITDFNVPTADADRPIPVVFGNVWITGPNCVWYGDLVVDTETEDGIKTRRYFMGLHFVLCHGPIDAIAEILVGERSAWSGSQIASGDITIDSGDLFGGKQKEGGIVGTLAVAMGEITQTANAYLVSKLTAPVPAFRRVVSGILEGGYVSANSTYIKPWAFNVNRLLEGWANDTPWYPAKVSCLAAPDADIGQLNTLIQSYNPAIFLRFEDAVIDDGEVADNEGTSAQNGTYYGSITDSTNRVPDGVQSADMVGNSYIVFADSTDYHYYDHDQITIGVFMELPSGWGGEAIIWHHGDRSFSGDEGQLFQLLTGGTIVNATYYSGGGWRSHSITLSSALPSDEPFFLAIVHSTTGGDNYFGYMTVYVNCVLEGTISFTHAVPDTTYPAAIGARRVTGVYDIYLGGYIDDFFLCTSELSAAQLSAIADAGRVCATGAMNPAHMIYEAITNPEWGMGYDSSIIDSASFTAAADTFYAEGLGLSLQWAQQSTVEDFIQIILDHAGAVLRISPTTGQFQLKPLRADYVAGSLDIYDEGEIVEIERFERAGYGELTGEITVIYTDESTGKDGSVTVQNLAVIQSQSGVVAETAHYPGAGTHYLASRLASRDLRAKSVPLARVKFTCNRSAWDLQPGDVFKLSWTKLGLTAVVCRVLGLATGTLLDGTITVEAVEDVYGLPDNVYASEQASRWVEPTPPLDTDTTSVRETEDGVDRADEITQYRIIE